MTSLSRGHFSVFTCLASVLADLDVWPTFKDGKNDVLDLVQGPFKISLYLKQLMLHLDAKGVQ